jgi:hypothetical protein
MAKKYYSVNYAKLHQSFFSPSLGDLGVTLPPTGKTWDAVMTAEPDGLHIRISKFSGKLVKKHLLIPAANVAGTDLGPKVSVYEDDDE